MFTWLGLVGSIEYNEMKFALLDRRYCANKKARKSPPAARGRMCGSGVEKTPNEHVDAEAAFLREDRESADEGGQDDHGGSRGGRAAETRSGLGGGLGGGTGGYTLGLDDRDFFGITRNAPGVGSNGQHRTAIDSATGGSSASKMRTGETRK